MDLLSQPPMCLPAMNTLGTVLWPVHTARADCISVPSASKLTNKQQHINFDIKWSCKSRHEIANFQSLINNKLLLVYSTYFPHQVQQLYELHLAGQATASPCCNIRRMFYCTKTLLIRIYIQYLSQYLLTKINKIRLVSQKIKYSPDQEKINHFLYWG